MSADLEVVAHNEPITFDEHIGIGIIDYQLELFCRSRSNV